jgi:hypothetical protein
MALDDSLASLRTRLTPVDSDVLTRWHQWYPDAPPLGFLLRDAYPDRWLRIHSLPESKRYPTSGLEYAELLHRQNAVAEDAIGEGESCAILLAAACDGKGVASIGVSEGLTQSALPRLGALPVELSDEETGVFATPMCIYGVVVRWRQGEFNRLITEVAEDRARGLVVNLDTGRVYAPYDGGADLFYRSEVERDAAKHRYRDWLSSREDGL